MVEIVESVEDLKLHAAYCRYIVYRIDPLGEYSRVRIRAGRMAYDGKMKQDETNEIAAWLNRVGGVKLKGSITEELFFS